MCETKRAKRQSHGQPSPGTYQWTGQMHHVFFTVVLPTVFEWCTLSDFFIHDSVFHKYEETGKPRGPYSVCLAVCKDWFAAVFARARAHSMRADYDVRVLADKSGGIIMNHQPMLYMWKTARQLDYLSKGGVSVGEAFESGVELGITQVHVDVFEKWCRFSKCLSLRRVAEYVEGEADASAEAQDASYVIQMRPVQIVGHPTKVEPLSFISTWLFRKECRVVFVSPPGTDVVRVYPTSRYRAYRKRYSWPGRYQFPIHARWDKAK